MKVGSGVSEVMICKAFYLNFNFSSRSQEISRNTSLLFHAECADREITPLSWAVSQESF